MLSTYLSRVRGDGISSALVRKQIYLVDSQGLLNRDRADHLNENELLYANHTLHASDLEQAVSAIKPSVLIGVRTERDPSLKFTERICRDIAQHHHRPIIFSLSSTDADVETKDVYRWTDGRAIFAPRFAAMSPLTVSPPSPTSGRSDAKDDEGLEVGRSSSVTSAISMTPRPCQSTYIFPGVVLGLNVAGAVRVDHDMFLAAAESLASVVTDHDRARGDVFPSLNDCQEVAQRVAVAVAERAYRSGVGSNLPRPMDLAERIRDFMYRPEYRVYK